MALQYISTCAGGDHHLFRDDATGDMRVISSQAFRRERLRRLLIISWFNKLPQAIQDQITSGNGLRDDGLDDLP
jgi:hypothetical protein